MAQLRRFLLGATWFLPFSISFLLINVSNSAEPGCTAGICCGSARTSPPGQPYIVERRFYGFRTLGSKALASSILFENQAGEATKA